MLLDKLDKVAMLYKLQIANSIYQCNDFWKVDQFDNLNNFDTELCDNVLQ